MHPPPPSMQIGSTDVSQWASDVGLDKYEGLPNRLEALASSRVDLAYLTDNDWSKLLIPLNLKVGKQRRVAHEIRHLRESHAVRALNDADEAEVRELHALIYAGERQPKHRDAPRKEAGTASSFVPANGFLGPRAGFVFQRGPNGLGYYRDTANAGGGGLAPERRPPLDREQSLVGRYHAEHEEAVLRERRLQQQRQAHESQQAQQQHAARRLHFEGGAGYHHSQIRQQAPIRTPQQHSRPPAPSPRSDARTAAAARLKASPFATGWS
jgi:hypothetical protein